MFSGIISSQVQIEKIELSRLYSRTVLRGTDVCKHLSPEGLSLGEGESIALDGICFTIVSLSGEGEACFAVDISPETFEKTTAKYWKEGQELNVERALRLNDVVSGHLVTGHVDGVGKIITYKKIDEFTELEVQLPQELIKYVISKGSLAINGISLTVNNVCDNRVSFMLIPLTLEKTNLKYLGKGDPVNIETDLIGKYVATFCNVI